MKYFSETIEDYTSTALLLNAVDVARKRYQSNPEIVKLSTTTNIPPELKFPNDPDYTFGREELVSKYRGDIIRKIASDYLIKNISTLDALLEDIYSIILKTDNSMSEKDIGKKIRAAWSNDNLKRCILDELDIQQPPKKKSTPEMSFEVYQCWRELRHALVHNKGKLGTKHINRLQQFESRLPKESHLLKSHLIKGNKIVLNFDSVLILRHWVYSFIFYLDYSFHVTLIYKRLLDYVNSGNIHLVRSDGKKYEGQIKEVHFEEYNLKLKRNIDGSEINIQLDKITNYKGLD